MESRENIYYLKRKDMIFSFIFTRLQVKFKKFYALCDINFNDMNII